MNFKSALRKGAELGIVLTAITTLILVGCGGGGASGSTTTNGVPTSATIKPYKGPFAQGATVTITDANGNPVTLLTGGTVGANGVISVTYNQNVTYPLLVSVTGSYYNEITKQMETTTVQLRGLITNAAGATNVPVTVITETAVALLMNQTGGISATNPLQAASAVAALSSAGTMYGIPASTVPSFNAGTNTTSDPNTILLSALAVIANSQAGTTLADKVVALANSLASLNAASAPSDVISQAALANAITAMTSGASSVAMTGVAPPTAPTISTAVAAPLNFNASIAAANSIVGTWNSGDTLNTSVITFFANGDYMQAKAASPSPGAFPGIEHSTYTFNSSTGAFVPSCPAAVDTNGTDGFCNGSSATTFTFSVNGDTMTFTNSHGQSGTLTRVIGNPLVGSWYNVKTNGVSPNYGTPTTAVITFFANGDYVQAQSVTSGTSSQPGLEHGTYTWNPTTGAFAAMCPTVDTNGQAGFSAPSGVQCAQGAIANFGTMTVSGNTLTYAGNGQSTITFDRVYSTTPGSIPGTALAAAAVTSLLSDEQSAFTGGWWLTPTSGLVTAGQSAGSTLAAAQVAADAYENTVVVNSPNNYTQTYTDKRMTSTSWGTNSGPGVNFILPTSTGSWVIPPNTATIVDNLDGTFTWTPTGLNSELVSVTRSDLSGTAITCTDFFLTTITCPAVSNYPTGAALYTFSNVPSSDEYFLFGSNAGVPSAISVLPITDATGTALTALPALTLTTTLCDPNSLLVFQAISPAPASGDNVNVFTTASCLQADITAATASTAMGTVSVTVQATGNATVASVIRVQATATATAYLNNSILGLRAGAVYPGNMNPAGVAYASSDLNKTAVNAELVANGLTPIP